MSEDPDRHIGSSFESFLEEEGALDEIDALAIKRVVAWEIQQAMHERHIRKKALAEALGTSRTQIDRLLDPNNPNIELRTITRAARHVGLRFKMEIDRVPVEA
jgi:DNA-binding Xre family transcriptional regulator